MEKDEMGLSLPEDGLLESMGFVQVLSTDRKLGVVRAEFEAMKRFCHTDGTIVQGGFISGWLDFSMAQAVIVRAAEPVGVASLELKVNFLQRVGPGRVIAEGRVLRMGRRVAFLEASLFDPAGALLATASSTALLTTR
jgi:acyl-CoA thioesterase